ncbi:MAG: L,D-transpeptidase family protein [Parcubacteria group bacterium]|nr:L,D-transpeptidase family protein [Parcubacteria group bacterium]
MKQVLSIVALLLIPPLALAASPARYAYQSNEGPTLYLPFDTIQSIAPIDLGGDGTSELVLGSPPGFVGTVYVIRLDGSIINSWLAYDEGFRGGVNVASGDLNGDGKPEIVTAPAGGGGPHVRIFDGYGKPKISPGFFAATSSYTQGVRIDVKRLSDREPPAITAMTRTENGSLFSAFTAQGALIKSYPAINEPAGSQTVTLSIQHNSETSILTVPKATRSIEREGKVIIIDLSDQTLSYYQDGFRLGTFPTSTGKPGYATPVGEHAVNRKTDLAYSRTYGLYMPYWMSFIGNHYGIHELPYWPGGAREGENHLGIAVSHGCVRLGVGPAKTLFEWAEVGTPVIVQP